MNKNTGIISKVKYKYHYLLLSMIPLLKQSAYSTYSLHIC